MTNTEIVTPYFTPSEFKCDGKPVLDKMNPDFLRKLVTLRERCNFSFTLNSSFRSPAKNKSVGGEPNSMHLFGRAVDIAIPNGSARWILVRHATEMGLSIGIMENAVHVDDRGIPVIFHYYQHYKRL